MRVCENCGEHDMCLELGCECATGVLSKMCVVCLREVGIPIPGEKTSAQRRRERMREASNKAKSAQTAWEWNTE